MATTDLVVATWEADSEEEEATWADLVEWAEAWAAVWVAWAAWEIMVSCLILADIADLA